MASIALHDPCDLDARHDPVVHFELDGSPEVTSPTQSSHSGTGTTLTALSFDCLPRQACEELTVDDGEFNFSFVGDLRSSVESMLEQMNDVGKVPVSFWRPDRDFGPISEPVSRSPSTVNNLGQLLACVPGRDAISQPVSRSVSHVNGLGSIGANARGKEAAPTGVPLVPKSSSALSGLGSIWGNVPRSATALGHTWTSPSAREPLAPRSVSALNNLGQMWTGASTSSLSHSDDPERGEEFEEQEEEREEEEEGESEPVPALTAEDEPAPMPPRSTLGFAPPAFGGIPRMAPMEFGTPQAAPAAPPSPERGPATVSVHQLMRQPLMLPIVQSQTLHPDSPHGPIMRPTSPDVVPVLTASQPFPGNRSHLVPVGTPEPPPRNRRERRRHAKPGQAFQHIQVLSDKVDSRVVEQGYYLAPSTEFRVSKSKARAPADAKGASCLPTYTYDYGTEADAAVWDILRGSMRRGHPAGGQL